MKMTLKFNEKNLETLFDMDAKNFINNYYLQEALHFSKDGRGLSNVFKELDEGPLEIYFLTNLGVTLYSKSLIFHYNYAENFLGKVLEPELSVNLDFLSQNLVKVEKRLGDFNKGLCFLAKDLAYIHDKKIGELLSDENALKEIHKRLISKDDFLELRNDYWGLYESLIKTAPHTEKQGVSQANFFEKVCDNFVFYYFKNSNNFINKKIDVGIKNQIDFLFKAKRFSFGELEEGLNFFKEGYHNKTTNLLLEYYF